jgi:serine/threonine protein kinase
MAALDRLIGVALARRYRILGLLGVGGMGAVFRGHDMQRDEDVAIKVLRPDLSWNPEAVARFEREAEVASRLEHPNCSTVYAIGQTRTGTRWLAMPLLQGRELTTELLVPIGLPRAFDLARQLFAGLEHAHGHGIVHRDIKPDNLFVTTDAEGADLLKIVDFGISRLLQVQASKFRTRMGLVLGTPAYMSPEQAAGLEADARADLYSAGLVMYEMVSGRKPFPQDVDAASLMQMQLDAKPDPLPAKVPPIFAAVVQQLLVKDRDRRIQSATEALRALDGVAQLVWPTGLERMLQARALSTRPAERPVQRDWPSERSDAQAIDEALQALLHTSTPMAQAKLNEGIRPSRKRSVTEVSGIDMNDLQLVELEPPDGSESESE